MMLYLLLSLFASQVFLASPLAIGNKRLENKKDLLYFEGEKAKVPSFLLTFYNQIMAENEAHRNGYLLKSFREECKLKRIIILVVLCCNKQPKVFFIYVLSRQ